MRGRDIKHNAYTWAHLYLICTFPAANIDIKRYPAIEKHLQNGAWCDGVPGELRLEQTGESHTINGVKFKSRKKTGNKWFETQDQIAYMDDFFKPKIIYSDISQCACFYLDDTGFMVEATGFIMSGSHLDCLVKYLNSDVITWIFKTYYAGVILGSTGYKYQKRCIIELPIPRYFVASEINENKICELFHLTTEEIEFIKNSL